MSFIEDRPNYGSSQVRNKEDIQPGHFYRRHTVYLGKESNTELILALSGFQETILTGKVVYVFLSNDWPEDEDKAEIDIKFSFLADLGVTPNIGEWWSDNWLEETDREPMPLDSVENLLKNFPLP